MEQYCFPSRVTAHGGSTAHWQLGRHICLAGLHDSPHCRRPRTLDCILARKKHRSNGRIPTRPRSLIDVCPDVTGLNELSQTCFAQQNCEAVAIIRRGLRERTSQCRASVHAVWSSPAGALDGTEREHERRENIRKSAKRKYPARTSRPCSRAGITSPARSTSARSTASTVSPSSRCAWTWACSRWN